MTMKNSKPEPGARDHQRTEDADERRFNETLHKMLNTPPKPYKSGEAGEASAARGASKQRKEGT